MDEWMNGEGHVSFPSGELGLSIARTPMLIPLGEVQLVFRRTSGNEKQLEGPSFHRKSCQASLSILKLNEVV